MHPFIRCCKWLQFGQGSVELTPAEKDTQKAMMTYWTNFAKTGYKIKILLNTALHLAVL